MASQLSVVMLSTVGVLVTLCVGVCGNVVTVGDVNWYNNNNLIQQHSMQLAQTLRTNIFNKPTIGLQRAGCNAASDLTERCVPLLVQQNINSTGSMFFHRNWTSYKVGFNDSKGNYWIGNELLHQLTTDGRYKLRFDLQFKSNNVWVWAEYDTFIVFSEATGYEVHMDKYSGNSGYDSFKYHDRMKFSTYDRDADECSGNCAAGRYGGFWYKCCKHCNPNGKDGSHYWNASPYTLKTSRMWLLCR